MYSRLKTAGWISAAVVLMTVQCKTRQNRDYSRHYSTAFQVSSGNGSSAAKPITTVHLILGQPDEFTDEEVAAIEAELSGTGGLGLAGASEIITAEERMAEAARKADNVRGDAADLVYGRRATSKTSDSKDEAPKDNNDSSQDLPGQELDSAASAALEADAEDSNREASGKRSTARTPVKKNALTWGSHNIPVKDQTAASLNQPDSLSLVDDFWVRNPNLQKLVLHGSDSKLSRALDNLQLEPPVALTSQSNLTFTSEGQNGGLYEVRKSKGRVTITRQE